MRLKERNFLGFNHEEVCKKYEGDLSFLCEMPLRIASENGFLLVPAAVYKSANPDRSKGHKEYMLLFSLQSGMYVTGRDDEELKSQWWVKGILCQSCNTVLISLDTHDFHKCGCQNETMVDGGAHYMRYGGKDMNLIKQIRINMKTKEVIPLTLPMIPAKV